MTAKGVKINETNAWNMGGWNVRVRLLSAGSLESQC